MTEPEHKHGNWHVWVATILLVGTTWSGMVVSWTTLNERTNNLVDTTADHSTRIRNLEVSRTLEEKIGALSIQITRLEGEISALRSEVSQQSEKRNR